jgi:uroporphyrin-III C-methyltransferase
MEKPQLMSQPGIVYIVGAGPGDPDLITVRGLKSLQRAEVVVYDRLINRRLLDEAPPLAEFIYVGKEPGQHTLSQTEINALLVQKAAQGKVVVRLKGGDPFVFGRGGEECQALVRAGIPFEVVPGISSSIAVPAYAGIPLTHRDYASAFTVITGHTAGPDNCAIDWQTLPKTGTLVILMGIRNLAHIAQALIEVGRPADTPAAVIGQGTTEKQTVVTARLDEIAAKASNMRPPATIVIGQVAALSQEMAWFHPQARASETEIVDFTVADAWRIYG